jgi:Ca2+-binding RTX toxin-like protein
MEYAALLALTLLGLSAGFVVDASDEDDETDSPVESDGTDAAGTETDVAEIVSDGLVTSEGVTFGTESGESITASEGSETVVGAGGDDEITGNSGDNILDGQIGDDSVFGGGGNDQVFGSEGNDSVDGNSGDDLVAGGTGNDILAGGIGNDSLFGDSGDDLLDGQEDDDELVGGDGDDTLFGGSGGDTLFGSDGNDSLVDGDGDDFLFGGSGADTLDGGPGNDQLFGVWDGNNDDVINARDLDDPDLLLGGQGSDDIQLGSGDVAFGEAGNDVFFTGTWVDPDNAPEIIDLEADEVVIVSVPEGASATGSITIETDELSGDSIIRFNGQTVVVVSSGAGPVSLDQVLVVESIDIAQAAA